MNQPTPRELALAFLTAAERVEILAGERPRKWEGAAGRSGPLRPQVRCRPFGLEVEQHSADLWAAEVAWHSYWREHGYHTTNAELLAAAPPRPEFDPKTRTLARVTWGQLREWIAEDAAPEQLELELCAA